MFSEAMGAPDLLNPERRMLRAMQLSEPDRSWDLESLLAACEWTDQAVAVGQDMVCKIMDLWPSMNGCSEKSVWTLVVMTPTRTVCSSIGFGRG